MMIEVPATETPLFHNSKGNGLSPNNNNNYDTTFTNSSIGSSHIEKQPCENTIVQMFVWRISTI